jgi:hypothetical protein
VIRVSCGIATAVLALSMQLGCGQEKSVIPDLRTLADGARWQLHNASAEAVEVDGKKAVRLKAKSDSARGVVGLALPAGVSFSTGVIEVELKGKNVKQESFLGVAFNLADEKTFEAIYFRPFNFKAEGAFKDRAVQYIAWPENTWEKLRKDKPGKFEAAVSPVPDPDGWFRARIEVGENQVRVYVNEAKAPCLTVDRLAEGGKGRPVGLFVDVADGLYASFQLTPPK